MSLKFKQYQKLALRTSPDHLGHKALSHAAFGLATEIGEFIDPLKKHIYYKAKLDTENMKEELGDILWYAALAAEHLGTTLEEVAKSNIEKLQKRYPEKFTEKDAKERKDKEIVEDAWIFWEGGKCPVEAFEWVDIKRRGSSEKKGIYAGNLSWRIEGGPNDILYYRVSKT